MQRRQLLTGLAGLAARGPLRAAAADEAPVRQWVERARSLKSVAAEFRQERYRRALNKPLITAGRLWHRADGTLRRQLGEPPRTIALRTGSGAALRVIEPEERTVRSFAADEAGINGGALALFDAGFPESYEACAKRFRLDAS